MRELALNILDLLDNSIKAKATLAEIIIEAKGGTLKIEVRDNGAGMDADLLGAVKDPYVTTRRGRKVGMGLALLGEEADRVEGTLDIRSVRGEGTTVTAVLPEHIDRAPLGDLAGSLITLLKPDFDWVLVYTAENKSFTFDTREVRSALGDIPIDTPEIITHLKSLLTENIESINGGIII